jgi:hypothetical protein
MLITIGGDMAAENSILQGLNEDSFGSRRLDDPIEFWGTPLGEIERPCRDNRKPTSKAPSFYFRKTKNLAVLAATSFQPHRMLIAATAILAALGVITVASIWSSADEKIAAQAPQPVGAVQSSQSAPESPAQTVSVAPQSSPDPSFAAKWPDLPASTVETSANGPAASDENTAARETASASQNQDIVFVQQSGVHIRSGPSANTRVVGSARKGTRLTVRNREGDWVQVESDQFTGWIKSRFVAANEPQ